EYVFLYATLVTRRVTPH
ncbi:hypothetical protein KIPB_009418, partial [Kipferlia bialata]